jgi:DNA transformation protein
MPARIEDLHSLGPVTAKRLAEVGIGTAAELRRVGAVAAYLRLRHRFGRDVTLNALYGLDAAVRDVHWRSIEESRKAELREAVQRAG